MHCSAVVHEVNTFNNLYPLPTRLYQITKGFPKNRVKLSRLWRRHPAIPMHMAIYMNLFHRLSSRFQFCSFHICSLLFHLPSTDMLDVFFVPQTNIHYNETFLVNWEYMKQIINPRMKWKNELSIHRRVVEVNLHMIDHYSIALLNNIETMKLRIKHIIQENHSWPSAVFACQFNSNTMIMGPFTVEVLLLGV